MIIQPDNELGFRGLTVKQPYASQIASGHKRVEFRSWGTDYRGDILISASSNPRTQGPHSCAICVVTLVDTVWADDCVEWMLANPRPVRNVKARGALQLWTVPDQLVRTLGFEW